MPGDNTEDTEVTDLEMLEGESDAISSEEGQESGSDDFTGGSEEEEREGETEAKEEDEPEEDESAAGIDDGAAGIELKAIEKAFPGIFKKYPTLKSTIWREQKFTEFFPTVEQARDAYKQSQAFSNFEQEIMAGQSQNLLQNVRQVDERAFQRFSNSFLGSLQKIDPDTFNSVVGPVILRVVQNVYATGKQHNNEDLTLSAQHISRFLFGDHNVDQIRPPEQQRNEISEEEQRIQHERQKFFGERRNTVLSEVVEQTDSVLKRDIDKGLGDGINEFTKSALSDKILKRVNEVLSSDERHMAAMRSMWEKAERAGFSAEWRNRIRNYYLSRAKAILPSIRAKAKSEASRRPGAVPKNQIPTGRASSGITGKVPLSAKHIDYSKTSDMDILNGKVTRK